MLSEVKDGLPWDVGEDSRLTKDGVRGGGLGVYLAPCGPAVGEGAMCIGFINDFEGAKVTAPPCSLFTLSSEKPPRDLYHD